MKMNEYQGEAVGLCLPQCWNREYLVLGICSEAGEIAGIKKKGLRGDAGFEAMVLNPKTKDELGDLLWYLVVLADCCGFSMEEVAEGNLEKLRQRKEAGTLGQSERR